MRPWHRKRRGDLRQVFEPTWPATDYVSTDRRHRRERNGERQRRIDVWRSPARVLFEVGWSHRTHEVEHEYTDMALAFHARRLPSKRKTEDALHNIRMTTQMAPNVLRRTQTTTEHAGQASDQRFHVALTRRRSGVRAPQRPLVKKQLEAASSVQRPRGLARPLIEGRSGIRIYGQLFFFSARQMSRPAPPIAVSLPR